ncbi:MAG TPA: hypothetical protein VF494_10050 [Candidatus Limnocylindrales bacterium]
MAVRPRDTLRRLPWAASLFAVLALARLGWGLREAALSGFAIDPWRIGQVVLLEVPSVVAVLLPGALLARHRDAPSRMRMLFVGTLLLAVVEALRILGSPLEPLFESLTPGDEAATFVVPSALAYQVAIGVLNSAGVAAIAAGLMRARWFDDRSATWPVDAVLATLVVLVGATGIMSLSRLPAEQLPMTVTIVAYIVSTVVLNVMTAAAFGYLAATTTAGARAGENPRFGWRLGAIGSWLVVGSLAALGVAGLAEPGPDSAGLANDVVLAIEAVFSIGFIALLAAFALGVPSLDPIEVQAEAVDDDAGAPDAIAASGV